MTHRGKGPKAGKDTTMGAVAVGCNVVLSSHIDQDFYYSMVSTHVDTEEYTMDMPIVQYFTFPTLGYAVALRPGDVLAFNALIYHLVSTKLYKAEDQDVFCSSVYLKSQLVGGNDNSKDDLGSNDLHMNHSYP